LNSARKDSGLTVVNALTFSGANVSGMRPIMSTRNANVEAIADPTNPPLNLDESGTVNTPHSILFRMDNSYGGSK
jgi:hypothetical protein